MLVTIEAQAVTAYEAKHLRLPAADTERTHIELCCLWNDQGRSGLGRCQETTLK